MMVPMVVVQLLLGAMVAVVGLWLLLVVAMLFHRPSELTVRQVLQLVPECARLFRSLASDASVSRGARVRIWLLLCYLAFPIDLIPDFVPILGYADDAILVLLVARSVLRSAGPAVVASHWAGDEPGLETLLRAAGMWER